MFSRSRSVAVLVLALAASLASFGQVLPAFAGASTISMSPALHVGAASGNFVINVYANTQGQQMRAYEFGLSYDNTKIDIVSITEGPFMKDWATSNGGSTTSATGGWNSAGNSGTIAPAGYAVAGAGSAGVSGTGIIAVITVQALAATSGGTNLNFSAGSFLADNTITPMTPLTSQGSQLFLGETPPIADLIVESINLVPNAFDENDYKVEVTVKNQGGAAAAASSVEVKIDTVLFETLAVGPLAINGTSTVSTVGEATLTPESDTIDACADSGSVVTELSELNNCGSTAYSLIESTDEVDTDVEAELAKYISLRAPADIPHENWLLKIGANAKADNGADGLGVKSNANWTVSAADLDTANTNGNMKEHDGAVYQTAQLFDPLHVVAANDVTLPTAAILQSGGPNTADDWQEYNTTFNQNVRFRDLALDANWYQLVVTFSGSTSF